MSDRLRPLIGRAAEGPLTREQAEAAFAAIMDGDATPAQIGGFLMALRTRGETVAEYAAAAAVMRAQCLRVRAPEGAIDIVGTGGDGKGTLNISTAAAFVVAGAGVVVAKHGNRNLSSKSGAADALTELGVNVMVGPEVVERALAEAGIGFMMAPMHHPAMRNVMPARTELGTRTIFNILGPLTNPAAVRRQLTGAFSRAVIRPMAETLGRARLGPRLAGARRRRHRRGLDLRRDLRRRAQRRPGQRVLGASRGRRAWRRTRSRRSSAARPPTTPGRCAACSPARPRPTATRCCSTPPRRWWSPTGRPTCARAWRWRPRASTPAPRARRADALAAVTGAVGVAP